MKRSQGFTLIELLVVIAIIGILAAMLFPVFARARESARKTQCLANVKNIAMGFQIYLTDYDRLPPKETRAEVVSLFCDSDIQATTKNPYLRIPVILEEYIKSREVWRCPSAKVNNGARAIIGGDWFKTWQAASGGENCASDAFSGTETFPPGWGGEITDSILQGQTGLGRSSANNGVTGAFVQTIGVVSQYYLGKSPNALGTGDSTKFVVTGDAGVRTQWMKVCDLAYPDICKPEADHDCTADWANCTESQVCGLDAAAQFKFWTDPNYAKQYTRHMGGSNLGFLDGHAKWMPAQAIYADSQGGTYYVGQDVAKKESSGELRGMACCDSCYCQVKP
jgi:prepilin-type N-terminal cleavage/methylation domain-containing protein/prepilin-type processing-associated H-X9-DG protein